MRSARRWMSVAALAAVAMLGVAARADAYIYWTAGTTIGRANLDGSGVNPTFITGISPFGMAVDGAHIYWTDHDAGTIGRANLDGTGVDPAFIVGAHDPIGVTSDGSHVYWANHADATIGRANVDGSDVEQGFLSSPYAPAGPESAIDVAVDGAHVYWSSTAGEVIGRSNLDGSGIQKDFLPDAYGPLGVDVDGGHVYWTNYSTIGRANLDGTDFTNGFITSGRNVSGIAVDRTHIYWSDGSLAKIGRANLDGSGQRWIVKKGGGYALAVDGLGSQAPALRRLRISPHGVRRHRQAGATVRYADSAAATTTITVLARRHGHYVAIRHYRHNDVAGANHFRLTAALGGRPLRPGRYRLTARPSLTGMRGAARTISFRVLG